MKITKPTKLTEVQRVWHLIDAKDKILGRVAVEIARLLIGKGKPYFINNLDCGDYVVVINSSKVRLSGKKETEKVYTRYSGYPSGLKRETVEEIRAKKPERLIEHAVYGMLPKNKLRDRMIIRLYAFADESHPYSEKLKVKS
jgi:large subunit ribosomal protein L13